MKLVHSSPLGAIEIPGVLGAPKPGEPFDAPDDIAKSLLKQSDVFTRAATKKATAAEEVPA